MFHLDWAETAPSRYEVRSFSAPRFWAYKSVLRHDRNLILVDAVIEILGIKKRDWNDIKRDLSDEQVREIFQVVGYLWPPGTDLPRILPAPDSRLRGLFLGLHRPEDILENVLRYSLYTDEIVVVSPFPNPHCIVDKLNPLLHPQKYKPLLLKLALMLLQLAPWILAGIVVLIPDPGDFDYTLRKAAWNSARERWKERPYPMEEDFSKYERFAKMDFRRTMARTPRPHLQRFFKQADPYLDDAATEAAIDQFLEATRHDPLRWTNRSLKVANSI